MPLILGRVRSPSRQRIKERVDSKVIFFIVIQLRNRGATSFPWPKTRASGS